jgi:hypothetical protein
MRKDLLAWQWNDYPERHRDRVNLWIHVAVVPLFWAGLVNLLGAPVLGGVPGAIGGVVLMGIALGAQGRGHRREALEPIPFDGPGDAISRLFVEQIVTFPRYVLTGGWRRALQAG